MDELGNDVLKLSMNSDIACSESEVRTIVVLVVGRCILPNSVTFNSSMNSWSEILWYLPENSCELLSCCCYCVNKS